MLHGIDERELLGRLHDRHKRFSLEVYDHLNSREEAKLVESRKKLREIESELTALHKKLLKDAALDYQG